MLTVSLHFEAEWGEANWQGLAESVLLLAAEAESLGECSLAVVLGDDAFVQRLNAQFRGKDAPTNVLSFPTGEEEGELGDIILARETIEREAAEQGKQFGDHFCHLLLHGFLHLLGYDHLKEDETEEMEAREVELLARLGIDNPYENCKPL